MNEKLNKKLAEWAGIKWKITERTYNHLEQDIWVYPDDTIKDEPPDFAQSLDACFKWLVPKVIKSADYSIIITQNLARCSGYVRPMQGGKQYDAIDNQNPALALCLAIEKLIDSEKDERNRV